jgi:hypothetical protein
MTSIGGSGLDEFFSPLAENYDFEKRHGGAISSFLSLKNEHYSAKCPGDNYVYIIGKTASSGDHHRRF